MAVPTSPKIRPTLGIAEVPSPELLAEGRTLLLAYIAEKFDRDKVLGPGQGTLDPFLACLGIEEPAFVGCCPNGGAGEAVDEVTVGYEESVEIREVHSLEIRAEEMAELETEATSGFAEHIHTQPLLDQETFQILPFDPAVLSLVGRFSLEIARSDSADEEVANKPAQPSYVVASVET